MARAISRAGAFQSAMLLEHREALGDAGVTDIGARAGNKSLHLIGGAAAERAPQLGGEPTRDPWPSMRPQHGLPPRLWHDSRSWRPSGAADRQSVAQASSSLNSSSRETGLSVTVAS